MNKDEYKDLLKEIDVEALRKKNTVWTEYALSNNPYKIDQIIEDHYQRIRITKIVVKFSFNTYPECVYRGPNLKKNNKPFKSGEIGDMWQGNVLKLISQ